MLKKPSMGMLEGAVLAARVAAVFFPNKKLQLALSVGKQMARTALRAEKLRRGEQDRELKATLKGIAKAKGLKWSEVEAKEKQSSRVSGAKEV